MVVYRIEFQFLEISRKSVSCFCFFFSLVKFETLTPNLLASRVVSVIIFLNSSLIETEVKRVNVKVIKVPATDIANELGNVKVANLVLLGAFIKKTGILDLNNVLENLHKFFPKHKQDLVEINRRALLEGAKLCS